MRPDQTRADLTWKDNSHNETGFRLMRRSSGDYNWQIVILLPANQTSYTDVSLDPKENYVYRLVANAPGNEGLTSAYSESVTAAGLGSEAFEMSEPQLEDSVIAFSILTESNKLYVVEQSFSLGEDSWKPVAFGKEPNEIMELQSLEGDGKRMTIYLAEPAQDRAFFRVLRH